MRHILKADFNRRSDAQHVLDALLTAGYSGINIALSRAPPATRGNGALAGICSEHAERPDALFARTFTQLFRSRYQQAMARFSTAMRGAHVVTIITGSEQESRSAVSIIERFHPAAIEGFHDESDRSGTDVPGAAANVTAAETLWSHATRQPGTALRALQHYAGMDRHDPGAHDDDDDDDDDVEAYRYGIAMRTDDRYRYCSWDEVEQSVKKGWEARTAGTTTGNDADSAIRRGWRSTSPAIDDDRYFRAHWNAIYRNSVGEPGYDDRTPAYMYGSEARRSEMYRSHDWCDVEPDIEADWKARHAGQHSSWEDFKDAVKCGWNRVSPDM